MFNGEHLSHFVRSLDLTLSYNGGQKNLGLCERNSSVDSAPKGNFLFGFGFIQSSLPLPTPIPISNVVAKKHSFKPILLQNQICLEWEGRGRQFY